MPECGHSCEKQTSEGNSSSFRTLDGLNHSKEFRLFQQKSAEEKFAQFHQYDVFSLDNGVGAIDIRRCTERRRKQ